MSARDRTPPTRDGVPGAAPQPDGPTPAPAAAPAPPAASALRLLGTLAVAGAVAGLLIVLVYEWAQPRILEHRERVLEAAVLEVLAAPASYTTLYLRDGSLSDDAAVAGAGAERVFLGYDDTGLPVGFALETGKPGFQDVIGIIFGYDPVDRRVLGMKVLESKETPGLGDKIEKDESFVGAFRGVAAPIRAIKPGAGRGDADEVETITGATISARTIIDAINIAIEKHHTALEAYLRGAQP